MAFFDFLKHKEFTEIKKLNEEIVLAHAEIKSLKSELFDSNQENNRLLNKYKDIIDLEKKKDEINISIDELKSQFDSDKEKYESEISIQKGKINDLSEIIKDKEKQIVELDDEILLQEFGLYSPTYDFATSCLYKDKLKQIREQQKELIRTKKAAICNTKWLLNGSRAEGRTMTNQNIKQIVRCFNDECDVLISKVRFNNVLAYREKINKSADLLNKINKKNSIVLTEEYINLKIEELELAYEYAVKKQEEKEEASRLRAALREEARLQREIEERRQDIKKEKIHYINALSKVNNQMNNICDEMQISYLQEKKLTIEKHIAELDESLKDIDYREANKKAGYVYIISNIGSFGENVYKIGMTRRLNPMDRVDELGDASVPFKFDVHALIFSDDAPKLESALHHAFESKKVNMINGRREFFRVTLDEIKNVVNENYDKTVDFIMIPQAEQYRETQKIIDAYRSVSREEIISNINNGEAANVFTESQREGK